MDAGEVFGLNCLGRTTVRDGRRIVVYDDGRFVHAVLADHWDNCGFDPASCDEEGAVAFDRWNRARDQWPDDLTAIEAAWRLDVDAIHSAHSGSCRRMESDSMGACRAVVEAHRGEHYTHPLYRADADRFDWSGVWPLVDRDGDLTGEITEGEECYGVNDEAMIEAAEAREGGWQIDEDSGYAEPPQTVPPPQQRWIETAEQADEFLLTHRSVRLDFVRKRGGWVAVIHGSTAQPLPHGPMRLRDLERTLAFRYLAETFGGWATVHLPWARQMPNWASNNGLGALPELARAIEQAEREQQAAAMAAAGRDE